MISNPKYGWCDFELEGFVGRASFLTDVPVETLKAFIDRFIYHQGVVCFDEEGSEFSLVLTPYSIYIIESREDEPVLHEYPKMDERKLARELVEDINNDLDGWAWFDTSEELDEIDEHKKEIQELANKLDELLRVRGF